MFNSSASALFNLPRWTRGPFADAFRGSLCFGLLAFGLQASSQTVNLFPADAQTQWTRIAIPPGHPVSDVAQWHIEPKRGSIVCDGNGGHEWLRFNHELRNFTFRVQWRFTRLPGTPHYNSGIFFRNNEDGSVWHQAQTTLEGGYLFGLTPVDGKPQSFNEQKSMTENRVKPAGEWNVFNIRCVTEICTLAVNGKVVNTIHVGVENGYIGLESEGYQIEFRHFRVQDLP